ncbi:MAG: hypothetical protein J4F28_08675 [Nitrosopumilaceae archaeon]|nr:hypothetical protein [Nitrosopumilaceae archaeon]
MNEWGMNQVGTPVLGKIARCLNNGADPVMAAVQNGCRKASFSYAATHGRGARTA